MSTLCRDEQECRQPKTINVSMLSGLTEQAVSVTMNVLEASFRFRGGGGRQVGLVHRGHTVGDLDVRRFHKT